jgi:hypothetical protein
MQVAIFMGCVLACSIPSLSQLGVSSPGNVPSSTSPTAQASPSDPAAISSVRAFYDAAGWRTAPSIQSAVAVGTVQVGDKTEQFMLKIDRSGRVRTETMSPHIVMIAGPDGGSIRTDDRTKHLSIAEGTSHGASTLLPTFTAVAEIDSSDVAASSSQQDAGGSASVSIKKKWHTGQDSADKLGEEACSMEVTFDPATHLLKTITIQRASSESPFQKFPAVIEYSDWRPEGTVLLPHTIGSD